MTVIRFPYLMANAQHKPLPRGIWLRVRWWRFKRSRGVRVLLAAMLVGLFLAAKGF